MDFANIIREEAVLFLLDLPRGDEVSILAQKKKDGQCHGRTSVFTTASANSAALRTSAVKCEAVCRRSLLEPHLRPQVACN